MFAGIWKYLMKNLGYLTDRSRDKDFLFPRMKEIIMCLFLLRYDTLDS